MRCPSWPFRIGANPWRTAQRGRKGTPSGTHSPRCAARGERTRSRIVAKLADGIVTTPRAEADLVVTEYGIAELRGRTLAERARALVAVAAPAFRAELEQASEQLV